MSLFLNIAFPSRFAFPRSYVTRAILSGNFIAAPTISGAAADYTDNYGVRYHVELLPEFYLWSSNRYTLDYVIDLDNSHAYIGSTEVISGVFSTIETVINEGNSQLMLISGGGAGTNYLWPLPSPSIPYWLPQN